MPPPGLAVNYRSHHYYLFRKNVRFLLPFNTKYSTRFREPHRYFIYSLLLVLFDMLLHPCPVLIIFSPSLTLSAFSLYPVELIAFAIRCGQTSLATVLDLGMESANILMNYMMFVTLSSKFALHLLLRFTL